MGEAASGAGTQPKKRSSGLLVALALALLLGGGAFLGVYSGLVPVPFPSGNVPDASSAVAAVDGEGDAATDIEATTGSTEQSGVPPAFVALEPMLISLDPQGGVRHLRLGVEVEVDPARAAEVAALKPRLADVLNTFVRAVEPEMLERPRSMARLRAQILRRFQLVTPPGSVRDVLIQEFVLN